MVFRTEGGWLAKVKIVVQHIEKPRKSKAICDQTLECLETWSGTVKLRMFNLTYHKGYV